MLAHLWIGEAVVAVASVKARVARRPPFLHALKDCLKRSVYPEYDILQDLRVDLSGVRHRFIDVRRLRLLLVVGHTDTAQAPRFPTFPLLPRCRRDGTA